MKRKIIFKSSTLFEELMEQGEIDGMLDAAIAYVYHQDGVAMGSPTFASIGSFRLRRFIESYEVWNDGGLVVETLHQVWYYVILDIKSEHREDFPYEVMERVHFKDPETEDFEKRLTIALAHAKGKFLQASDYAFRHAGI